MATFRHQKAIILSSYCLVTPPSLTHLVVFHHFFSLSCNAIISPAYLQHNCTLTQAPTHLVFVHHFFLSSCFAIIIPRNFIMAPPHFFFSFLSFSSSLARLYPKVPPTPAPVAALPPITVGMAAAETLQPAQVVPTAAPRAPHEATVAAPITAPSTVQPMTSPTPMIRL